MDSGDCTRFLILNIDENIYYPILNVIYIYIYIYVYSYYILLT